MKKKFKWALFVSGVLILITASMLEIFDESNGLQKDTISENRVPEDVREIPQLITTQNVVINPNDQVSEYTSDEINLIGESLSKFLNPNHLMMEVNEKPIVFSSVNFGGNPRVQWFDDIDIVPKMDRIRFLQILENLTEVLENSNCPKDYLINYISTLSTSISISSFTNDMACLGELKFNKLEFSSE